MPLARELTGVEKYDMWSETYGQKSINLNSTTEIAKSINSHEGRPPLIWDKKQTHKHLCVCVFAFCPNSMFFLW